MAASPSERLPTAAPGSGPAAAPPADPVADTVAFPSGAFPLGARAAEVDPTMRAFDEARGGGLAALLDASPTVWVHVPAFRLGRRLVTNGEYRAFLEAADPEAPERRFVDNPSLWAHVWEGLGLSVRARRVPVRGPTGAPGTVEETYEDCGTFVAAYLRSLRRDIERVVSGESLDTEAPSEEAKFRQRGAQTVMLMMPSHPLARAIFGALDAALVEGRPPANPAELAGKIGKLLADLVPALRAQRDPRRPDARPPAPEAVVLLQRAEEACKAGRPLAPSQLLYPRGWPSASGPTGLRFPGPGVPWEERPVTGVTLYEAAAYAAWLSLHTQRPVSLPNEAEWERAASWPLEAPAGLGAAAKALWPWWDPANPDTHRGFGEYFGHLESGGAAGVFADRREYRRVCDETARACGPAGQIQGLLGFAWQWTGDRFDPQERRYARFAPGRYPTTPGGGRTAPVYAYRPVTDPRLTDFVLRGAPPLVGGPGLVTRRFAACPLRASADIGFRLVIRDEAA